MYFTVKDGLEIGALVIAGGAMGWLFYLRTKDKKGLGVNFLQLVTIILVVTFVFILALEKLLDPQVVGTLLAGVTGYVLASVGKGES